MFMDKNDWSDDDLDDVNEMVVPVDIPTPITYQKGSSGNTSAYNERMARARQSVQIKRQQSSGIMSTNSDLARPSTASRQAPPIAVLSQEVEEMEIAEQQMNAHVRALAEETRAASEAPPPRAHGSQASQHDAPVHRSEPEPSYASRASPESADDDDGGHVDLTDDASYDADVAQAPSAQRGSTAVAVPRSLAVAAAEIDTSDLPAFLMRPGPPGAMVQCYIQRRKSGLARLYPTYEVYLKDGEMFLLSARRRKKQKMSNYKVSLDRDDLSRHSSNYFGKLKSNFMGTEFQMFDNGINPEKLSEAQKDGSRTQVRSELATVLYKQNVLGSRGPRKMKVIVPNVDEQTGNRVKLQPMNPNESMLERYKNEADTSDFVVLKNKQPKWNDQVGAYVLNFNGRVTRASVKNFQLCNVAKDPDQVIMQFGRVGKDAFTMDYQFPLCGLQAFGIALSSFDYKIACE